MIKSIFKVGAGLLVLTGAALGGALLIAGPQRTHAALDQVHTNLLDQIDTQIDDPAKLRSQLRELEAEYPERISQVRGDLAELRQQIRQLEREEAICERVVEMARADLDSLEPVFNEATAQRAAGGSSAVRVVAWQDRVYSYDRAANQVNQVRQTIQTYGNRGSDARHDLTYLRQQEQRLDELLVTLENERARFQSQMTQLSRQVDAIARNERLIDLLEERNRTIEECSSYEAASLDGLTNRLAEVRSRQQAELEMLASSQQQLDYEEAARMELSAGLPAPAPLPLPQVTASH
jgi:chromosome segregation ATPase